MTQGSKGKVERGRDFNMKRRNQNLQTERKKKYNINLYP